MELDEDSARRIIESLRGHQTRRGGGTHEERGIKVTAHHYE